MARSAAQKEEVIGRMIAHCNSDSFSEGDPCRSGNCQTLRIEQPGHPDSLNMVHPRDLKQRKLGTVEGKAAFLHAIAHIEFNAINLALDAIYRFRDLPDNYYQDWLRVAKEESEHHKMLVQRLSELGFEYGDFPVHNGLWDIALRTDSDLVARMALVPCVLEARGLDVTPPMIAKLNANEDQQSANILQVILDQEVDHVAIGLRWYRYACDQQGIDPLDRYIELIASYLPGRRQGPFNDHHRKLAGFPGEWMGRLKASNNAGKSTSG